MRTILLAALGAAACAPMAPVAQASGPCALTEAVRARYIAVKFRESMRDALRRDASARTLRLLRPGDVATMDIRPDRLDVLLDDGGQIEGLRCG